MSENISPELAYERFYFAGESASAVESRCLAATVVARGVVHGRHTIGSPTEMSLSIISESCVPQCNTVISIAVIREIIRTGQCGVHVDEVARTNSLTLGKTSSNS